MKYGKSIVESEFAVPLINFNTFLQKRYVDIGGVIVLIVVIFGIAYGLLRWRKSLAERLPHITSGLALCCIEGERDLRIIWESMSFTKSRSADRSRARWIAHLAIFWGFLGPAVTTTLDEIVNPAAAPLGLTSPVRILGNISGVLFVAGVSVSAGPARLFVPSVRETPPSAISCFFCSYF